MSIAAHCVFPKAVIILIQLNILGENLVYFLQKIERLKSELHLLDAEGKQKNSHVFFVDTKKEGMSKTENEALHHNSFLVHDVLFFYKTGVSVTNSTHFSL